MNRVTNSFNSNKVAAPILLTAEEIERRLHLDFDKEAKKFRLYMEQIENGSLLPLVPFIENIPPLDLRRWNGKGMEKNSCANFAFDRRSNDFLQPGKIEKNAKQPLSSPPAQAALERLARLPITPIDSFLDCDTNYFPAAFFYNSVYSTPTRHWFTLRKDKNLKLIWAEKEGRRLALTVPDNDIFAKARSDYFEQFLGYFAIPHSLRL